MMPSSQDAHGNVRDIGDRLREAREGAGLSLSEVSERLKIPVRALQALERGDAVNTEAAVFVRGQMRSYARLLGVHLDESHEAVLPVQPTSIAPMSYTPPLQRVADRVMGRMVYVVITALIAVPVWMATRSHLDGPIPAASLDIPATEPAAGDSAQPPPATSRPPRPLVASMASIPPRAQTTAEPAISLRFSDDSWVEVFDPEGRRVEQGLLKAGDRRDYEPGKVGRMVLGNARTVEVRLRGHVQDLSAYRRADVARFTVSSDGSLAPTAE